PRHVRRDLPRPPGPATHPDAERLRGGTSAAEGLPAPRALLAPGADATRARAGRRAVLPAGGPRARRGASGGRGRSHEGAGGAPAGGRALMALKTMEVAVGRNPEM